ncbi:hypothetical protein J4401_05365 [Candidatus Woesearchaeota archaeon]|nr:hypothetical protein [Candidatus Woesearchaeota archaeon]
MKITIDTKEDSHDEIRKVISLLTHLIGNSGNSEVINESKPSGFVDMFSDNKQSDSQGSIFGMFSDAPSQKSEPQPDVFSMFSESKPEPKEEKKVNLELIPY